MATTDLTDTAPHAVLVVEAVDADAAMTALHGKASRASGHPSHFGAVLGLLSRLTGPELEFLAAEGLPRELANRGYGSADGEHD